MSKKYIIPIIILVGLGLILVLLPRKKTHEAMPAEELLKQINSSSRFISPDVVADRLIKKDPSMILIDVRSEALYKEFSLPGALNMPMQDIIKPEQYDLLSQEGIDFIFFSTGDVLADQAWILCKRKGLENIYILKGGLNEWFTCFFLLNPPAETVSNDEIALYQFRSAVRQYFTGGEVEPAPKPQAETITVTPKKKKSAAEGGC
jgi:rhodanese-related sulfurtransferase